MQPILVHLPLDLRDPITQPKTTTTQTQSPLKDVSSTTPTSPVVEKETFQSPPPEPLQSPPLSPATKFP